MTYNANNTAYNVPPTTTYFDKPANKRLRPWVFLGSLILLLIGIAMIITTFTSWGTWHSLWGVLSAGITLAAIALSGFIAAITLHPTLAKMFAVGLVLSWIASVAVMIVNAAFLNGNMLSQCAKHGAARFSATCENVRDYHTSVFTVFGVLTAVWVPALIVASVMLARTSTLYRKQEIQNQQRTPAPVGSSSM